MKYVDRFEGSLAAAHARLDAVRPAAYARSRNHLEGAVTRLSPYLTHGFVTLPQALRAVLEGHGPLPVQHKLVFEFGWREYFRHVWAHRGDGILASLRPGPLPEREYASELPDDIRRACTGVPAVDQAVRALQSSGYLHNHARMWLASYVVHLRKVHWRVGADWMLAQLLDGDLASNHLSWQWVAGTGSARPYLFNAENVARHAPAAWHSPGTVIDASYDELDMVARTPLAPSLRRPPASAAPATPAFEAAPTATLRFTPPASGVVRGRTVWLAHPWALGDPPSHLPADTLVVAVAFAEPHARWPWTARRWAFVGERLDDMQATVRWHGPARQVADALQGAAAVHTMDDPHVAAWLPAQARRLAAPPLFPSVATRCDAFSRWWTHVTRGRRQAGDLLNPTETLPSHA